MNAKLWQPIQVGNVELNHRLVMAPMTRGRSTQESKIRLLHINR